MHLRTKIFPVLVFLLANKQTKACDFLFFFLKHSKFNRAFMLGLPHLPALGYPSGLLHECICRSSRMALFFNKLLTLMVWQPKSLSASKSWVRTPTYILFPFFPSLLSSQPSSDVFCPGHLRRVPQSSSSWRDHFQELRTTIRGLNAQP